MRCHANILIGLLLFVTPPLFGAETADLEDRTREIAAELRCVVCQNLSVADSPSEMAQQMRAIVREQLQAGKTPQEIKDFFVSKYGEWVLLAPSPKGFGLLVWVGPFAVLIAGLGVGVYFLRRWATKESKTTQKTVDDATLARVRDEVARGEIPEIDLEASGPRTELLQERARLYADLKELEFDLQAGKLSESDFAELRHKIESRAATVLQQLDRIPVPPSVRQSEEQRKTTAPPKAATQARAGAIAGWKLVAGGTFLLVFGLALGLLLTQSVRPRGSEQDSMTGDFLTGTSQGSGNEPAGWLREGKAAFKKQDWPKAIEAFKKVLTADPNQPEAHTYMGLILTQAGHADGALLAFDKALAVAPDFPLALWGKGMTLYQAKQDSAGARATFEKLLSLMPPGQERSEVERVLAELSQSDKKAKPESKPAAPAVQASAQISGSITIDPKLKSKFNNQAALFIIARPAGAAGGPPLAVKKIDRPVFPLAFTLGAESVMMQGQPFAGKMNLSVRLDKDGNAMTRDPGDLVGEYKKNPVTVGVKDIDIVIDQETR